AQFRAQGIIHYSADHLLHLAERFRHERIGQVIAALVPPEHVEILLTDQQNWKVTIVEQQIVAHRFATEESREPLLAWPHVARLKKLLGIAQDVDFFRYTVAFLRFLVEKSDAGTTIYIERDRTRRLMDITAPFAWSPSTARRSTF